MADTKKWLGVAFKFIPYIGAFIGAAEQIKNAKGAEKQQRVLDAVQLGIAATEFAVDKDVLQDDIVIEATKSYIDAYVALQNAIARSKGLKQAKTPAAGIGGA